MKTFTSHFECIPEIKQYADIIRSSKSIHTQSGYFSSIDRFLSFLEVFSFEDITKIKIDQCENFKLNLINSGLQEKSVNTHLRNLKAFFAYLVDHNKISESPLTVVPLMKEPKKKRSIFSKEEVGKILGVCDTVEEQLMFLLLINLGPRRSELVNLKISNIVFLDDCVQIGIFGKGEKFRNVFLYSKKAIEVLKQHLNSKTSESDYLFESNHNKPYATETIRVRIKNWMKIAGIDDERIKLLTPHSCRRTTAITLLDEGVDAYAVKGVLGHESLNTTLLYLQHTDKTTQNAMKNISFG